MGIIQLYREWQARRKAFAEFEQMQDTERQRLILSCQNLLQRAIDAIEAGDAAGANRHWDDARSQLPGYVLRSKSSISILLRLRRLEELVQLMKEGLRRWPNDVQFLFGLAQACEAREQFDDAATWWLKACRFHSTNAIAIVRAAACLRRTGRTEEALRLLRRGSTHYPNEKDLWILLARISEDQRDWRRALQYWDHVGLKLRNALGFLSAARVCQTMGDFDGAIGRLQEALRQEFRSKEVLSDLATALEHCGSLEEAARAWRNLRLTIPREISAYEAEIRCLELVGKSAEADLVRQLLIEKMCTEHARADASGGSNI